MKIFYEKLSDDILRQWSAALLETLLSRFRCVYAAPDQAGEQYSSSSNTNDLKQARSTNESLLINEAFQTILKLWEALHNTVFMWFPKVNLDSKIIPYKSLDNI